MSIDNTVDTTTNDTAAHDEAANGANSDDAGADAAPTDDADAGEASEGSKRGVWYTFLGKVMRLPGVTIDREEFLWSRFAKHYDHPKVRAIIDNGTVSAGVPLELVEKMAKQVLKRHKLKVTSLSAAAGLPGGVALAATIPADLAQYYYHMLTCAQEMAYLYGYPDLAKDGDEDFLSYMTLFLGVMTGVEVAAQGMRAAAKMIGTKVATEFAEKPLITLTLYPIVAQIAKMLGKQITTGTFAKGLGKAIPIVGAAVSGGLTYAMFTREANRLQKSLRDDFILHQNPEIP